MNLKDIADLTGVSAATVSNVINGNHHKVSKETIEKVNQIIKQYDYKPNAVARSLAMKESKIIGVVIPNLKLEEIFSVNPNNVEIVSNLEQYIRSQGYFLMVRGVEKCREIIPLFSSWNMDGIIFLGAFKNEVAKINEKLKIPTLFIDTYADELPIANVGIDDYKGAFLATRYLTAKGHKQIAFAGPNIESPGVIHERFRGYSDAMKEKGIVITPDYIFEGLTLFEQGVAIGKQIDSSSVPFTAVVAMSDILAFGIMEGLRLCGLNVPEDVSVIGFDNLPECRYTNPQLTTISQHLEKKALLAGQYLFRMIRDKEIIHVNEKVDVEIIERHSVKQIIT